MAQRIDCGAGERVERSDGSAATGDVKCREREGWAGDSCADAGAGSVAGRRLTKK